MKNKKYLKSALESPVLLCVTFSPARSFDTQMQNDIKLFLSFQQRLYIASKAAFMPNIENSRAESFSSCGLT